MQRTEILKQIHINLRQDYIVSVDPDLPYLMSGPDILAGGNQRLTAIFIPRVSEVLAPEHLAVRLAFSRLALPKHTTCLLVINPDKHPDSFVSRLVKDFHATIEVQQLSQVGPIIEHTQVKEVPQDIRQRVFTRSSIIFDEALRLLSIQRSQKTASDVLHEAESMPEFEDAITNRWSHIPPRRRKRSYEKGVLRKDSVFLYGEEHSDHKSTVAGLKQFSLFSAQLDYDLNQGIPFPNIYPFRETTKIFVLDEVPTNRFDPDKYLRCAAFAGILATRADSVSEVEQLSSDVLEKVRRELR